MSDTSHWNAADAQFFADYPQRQAHVRKPRMGFLTDPKTHRTAIVPAECDAEFRQLDPHPVRRRRIILWRVPADNPMYDPTSPQILKIPFVLGPREMVEDSDPVLLALIHELASAELQQAGGT